MTWRVREVAGVAIDRPEPQYLAELALDFAIDETKWRGLIKTFQGAGFQELVETTRRSFSKVRFAKPDTSRARSSELYLLASGFRMV